MRNIKYVHPIPGRIIPPHIVECLNESPSRSGFYNWLLAFKGDIMTWDSVEDDLEKYDVVHVNMSPVDMTIVPEIRRKLKDSSTMLVLNNDHVCEYWQNWNLDPFRYNQIQRLGDMVFGTEENQVSHMIDGAFCMPHPTNTRALKRFSVLDEHKRNGAGLIYHWWNPQTHLAYLALEKARKALGLETTAVYGYKSSHDPSKQWVQTLFDEVHEMTDFPKFIQKVGQERFIYDPNGYHTYGRNGVEAACIGLPVIGSNRVGSYKRLFPEMVCDPYNADQTRVLMEALKNEEWVQEQLDYAHQEVDYYSWEKSKERFIKNLEVCEDRGGYLWNQ
jgi:hypothetical protein